MRDLTDEELYAAERKHRLTKRDMAKHRPRGVDEPDDYVLRLIAETRRSRTEIRKLSERCLCKGSFRCTPCLDAMDADGVHAAEVDEVRGDMLRTLELLRLLPVTTVITCHQCGGSSPEPEFCGCGGKQTAGEAIRWYESQLEILSK